jgi:hypothetical protein
LTKRRGNWRTRTRGTPRQIGQRFNLDSTSAGAKRAALPKLKGKAVLRYPNGKVVRYAVEDMPIEQLSTQVSIIQDPNPENFEARVQHFIDMYHRGETIPPILFHRLDDGTIQILDGRARMEAFRRMGLPRIPAVENGILSSIKSGLSKFASGTKGVFEGIATGKGNWQGKEKPSSVAQAVGRRVGTDIRAKVSGAKGATVKAANLAGKIVSAPSKYANELQEAYREGKGVVVKGNDGGGDIVVPLKRSAEPVTDERPLVHRPTVIEKRVKGKVLRTYGTLLDPRTNPRYLQKYGYTEVVDY